jgi:hypothetical protein
MRITLTFDSVTPDEMVTIVQAANQTKESGEDPTCQVREFGANHFTVTVGPIPPEQGYRITQGLSTFGKRMREYFESLEAKGMA